MSFEEEVVVLRGLLFGMFAGMFVVATVGIAAPLTLSQAFQAALSRSESVKQEEERIEQADSRVSQAIGGIFPTIAFNALHQTQPLPSDPAAQAFSPANQLTANLSATMPLFKGLREFYGLGQLKRLRASQRALKEGAVTRLFQEVAANVLEILRLEQDLKNIREQVEIYDRRVAELEARGRRGESSQSDVITAQATQATLAAELRLVQGQLGTTREQFQFLTGLDREVELTDPGVAAGTLLPLESYLNQVENRPDIKAAVEQWEASQNGVSFAWGSHAPSVDAYANYYFVRPGFLADLKWDVGVKFTFPLFEGGATQARVSEAVSKRHEAELGLERTRRNASQEIRSLYQRLQARMEHAASLQRAVELSKKNAEILQRDSRRGLIRNIDVQLALTEYRSTQRNFSQSHFAAQLDYYQLMAAAALLPLTKDTHP